MVIFLICPNGFCHLGLKTEIWFRKLALHNGYNVTKVIFVNYFLLFYSSSKLMLGNNLRINLFNPLV